ncbi:hypothetical protein GA0115240_16255 [Streptomyces sp. DvalAA-14]|uniref:hypothetical protein n=1 Tax=unclassified Streptomyces TaxID=2593676 RepID=UPI00081B419D|nr:MULTISPECIES: hypothetical protein [unclassified Streptomyces]MYS24271.1 hypothetical protein [Streptomyces sp. SID4948]SCE44501.1 hypothetical protein GA0115240_16255 [Streptomyces sp. DvalAA-14]
MELNADLRKLIHENSEKYVPSWAVVSDPKDSAQGRYAPLNMQWKHGVPVALQGEETWSGSCYIGWVKIAVTVDDAGGPFDTPDSARTVKVCECMGTIVTTDRRITGKLQGGTVLGRPLNDGQCFLFSLDYKDARSAQPVLKPKVFGSPQVAGGQIVCATAGTGGVNIVPSRGLNNPWDPSRRSVWGRGVGLDLWQTIVAAAGGGAKSTSTAEVQFPGPRS